MRSNTKKVWVEDREGGGRECKKRGERGRERGTLALLSHQVPLPSSSHCLLISRANSPIGLQRWGVCPARRGSCSVGFMWQFVGGVSPTVGAALLACCQKVMRVSLSSLPPTKATWSRRESKCPAMNPLILPPCLLSWIWVTTSFTQVNRGSDLRYWARFLGAQDPCVWFGRWSDAGPLSCSPFS